jgi:hypothetical protein
MLGSGELMRGEGEDGGGLDRGLDEAGCERPRGESIPRGEFPPARGAGAREIGAVWTCCVAVPRS